MMDNNQPKFNFRDYIDKNVNLFTVVGIFNALAIYSTSLDENILSDLLSFSFTMLSVALIFPLIRSLPDEESDSFDFYYKEVYVSLFRLGLIFIQFLLIVYVLKRFYPYILIVLFFIFVMYMLSPVTRYVTVPLIRYYKVDTKKRPYALNFQLLQLLGMIIALALAMLLTYLSSIFIELLISNPEIPKIKYR